MGWVIRTQDDHLTTPLSYKNLSTLLSPLLTRDGGHNLSHLNVIPFTIIIQEIVQGERETHSMWKNRPGEGRGRRRSRVGMNRSYKLSPSPTLSSFTYLHPIEDGRLSRSIQTEDQDAHLPLPPKSIQDSGEQLTHGVHNSTMQGKQGKGTMRGRERCRRCV